MTKMSDAAEETVPKIDEVDSYENAKDLGKSERTLIGLVVPDISNSFFSKVVKGIEDLARTNKFDLFLFNTSGIIEREKKAINSLRERKVDGLIYMGRTYGQQRSNLLADCDFPVVIIAREESIIDHPTVNIDNYQAAYEMTDYLLDEGYHKIAFIGGPKEDTTAGLRRMQGYEQALVDHKLETDANFIIRGDFTLKSGYQGMQKILSQVDKLDAVFGASDEMAVGAMRYLKEEGYNIPADIAVAGFDDISLAEYVNPSLTTVMQPVYNLGHKGMEVLINLIKGEELREESIVLGHEIIVRQST